MSKKIFSLIKGGKVHLAPKTKILPASAFSVAVEAEEVLKRALEDAERYKIEVAKEIEQIKQQAEKEGYEVGFAKWTEQIRKLEEEVAKVRLDVEKSVIPIALKAAKKIVGRELELSEGAIVDIVSSNLKAVAQHKKVTVYVNKKDLDVVEANRPRLREIFESLEVLSLRERSDIGPGGCVIETEGGIINAKLENRWRIMESAFETLLKQTPSKVPSKPEPPAQKG